MAKVSLDINLRMKNELVGAGFHSTPVIIGLQDDPRNSEIAPERIQNEQRSFNKRSANWRSVHLSNRALFFLVE